MKKALTLALGLLVSLFLFVGCSSEPATLDPAASVKDALVGTWTLYSSQTVGNPLLTAEEMKIYGITAQITLNADMTATTEFSGDVFTATWSLEDEKTVLVLEGEGETKYERPLIIEGDTLVMVEGEGRTTSILVKK